MHPRARHPRAASGVPWVVGVLVLALAGCAPTAASPGASGSPVAERSGEPAAAGPTGPPTPTTPSGPAALTASSTGAEVRERGVATSGVVVGYLDEAIGEVTVQDVPTHQVIWLRPPPDAATQDVLALIAAPDGGTVEVLADGSAVSRVGGRVVAAIAPPVVQVVESAAAGSSTAGSGTARAVARLVAVRGDVLQVVLIRPRGSETASPTDLAMPTVELSVADHGVLSLTWGDREGGRSLAVEPTDWARWSGEAGTELVWSDVAASEPEADSPTMRDQLRCHAIGAPDKATWNLEPWRPDVGLLGTLAAACNPT